MSFDGSGTFSRTTSGTPYVTGSTISSTVVNNEMTDIATGLSTAICKDGQTTVTANLPMATYRHTGVGNSAARTDYASAADVQDGTLVYLTSVAGTNTITATAANSMSAYATGQLFTLIPANTNTGATTININSIGAKNIYNAGAACVGNELIANVPILVLYDGTQFNLLNHQFNPVQRKVKTADETVNNSNTLQDDDHLTGYILTAGKRYAINGYLRGLSDTSAKGFGFALTFTNAPQLLNACVTFLYDNLTSSMDGAQIITASGTGQGSGCSTYNVNYSFPISGFFQANATTGGTLKLQWAQWTAGGNSTIYDGSWLEIVQLD